MRSIVNTLVVFCLALILSVNTAIAGDFSQNRYTLDALASIINKFPAREYVVRSPSQIGKGRRFGMLATHDISNIELCESTTAPWYGMALD